jgi:Cd2+/Zn2+-exporting ATPase
VAALDKTGTLTKGEFTVLETEGEEVLRLCATCEQNSSHPIAQSILAAYSGDLPSCESVQELPGKGLRVRAEGKKLLCGNAALMAQHGIDAPELTATAVYLAVDGKLQGWVLLGDRMKEETPAAVARLKRMGILPVMLTGDREDAARSIAHACGIEKLHAALLPGEKLQCMEQLRRDHGPVLFVGDGINDAPVLAGADVGAAMGSGADAAMEAADVVFMTSRSDAICQAIALARQTKRIAWQNVVFAIGIKAAVMLLGLLGFANMWLAVFADSGVAMLCVLNAIRLLYRKNK